MIDVLAIGAHPDDVEISSAGTLLSLKEQGYKIAIVDLTKADLSSNGTVEEREKEAEYAGNLLSLDKRINLNLGDGVFELNRENRDKIALIIRTLKPQIIIAPYFVERHPDHERCSQLVKEANFYAGLKNYPLELEAHRADKIYFATFNYDPAVSVVYDISDYMDRKMEVLKAYKSQFINKEGSAKTFINRPQFLEFIHSKAQYFGEKAGIVYGEAYFTFEIPAISTFIELGRRKF